MPQFLATTYQNHEFIWWDSFVVMTSNVNFSARPIVQLSGNCFVCGQSSIQQKNHKNGSEWKFIFEVASWKLINENHSCFLPLIGKQCGN